jgi:HNH endonuclease/AP2 domain
VSELLLRGGEVALVDEEDLPRTLLYGWYASQTSRKTGKPKIYVQGFIPGAGRPSVYLHRLVMDAPKGIKVDHRDGNTFDCRKANLRLATDNQNAFNRMPNTSMGGKPCASKYKGVSLERRTGKWVSSIGHMRVLYHIGTFADEIKAAEAYDDFSHWLHGEFGFRNFPERAPREFKGTVDVKSARRKA